VTTVEIVLLSFCTVLLGALILVAVQFLTALQKVLDRADATQARTQAFADRLLDRVMAGDFAIFKAYQAAEEAPEGGWEGPDPSEVRPPDFEENPEERENYSLTGMRLPSG
jgi:hypothetical protein